MTAVLTGLGLVSPAGDGPAAYWAGLLSAGSEPVPVADRPGMPDGARAYRLPEPDAVPGPGPVPGWTSADGSRYPRIARTAAAQALADAGIRPGAMDDGLVGGLFLGTGTGDGEPAEELRDGRRTDGKEAWWPYRSAADLADQLGFTGPVQTVSTACAAGAYAVALAVHAVTSGRVDVALAGGVETVSRPALASFMRLGAVDPVHCRPFDADRAGTVYGEGAAFLVVESEERAAARGADPIATVGAGGWSCDGSHLTAPETGGVQALRAAHDALDRAGFRPEEIAAVVCHGTGTPLNDRTESKVMNELLGHRAATVPVTAPKSVIGHSGGAAGAFACATAALMVRHRRVPPVANLTRADPDCALAARAEAQPMRPGPVLLNAYAFGGNNISLVVGPVSS
ncbi:beta-ketoacyl synthase N-terminal-like domain-containing protein [Streptomyces sp. NPDC002580]|uniref:beta-ketoacyl synthase N-terminal-like domain-containing protein n=1 Tax=Streptomyces sp. NPDC002580 TaxID=3364653 RepID=UPI0036BF8E05